MGRAGRLAHGWLLMVRADLPPETVREFVRPAIRAVPRAMAARLGPCHILLSERLESPAGTEVSSRWSQTGEALDIIVATKAVAAHDLTMELLLCLGQALWENTVGGEREAYWKLLGAEIEAGVTGEIDDEALRQKRALLSSRTSARSIRRLQKYAQASFAATAAEYIHSLWHDVTIRTGPEHLAAPWLRRRLDLMARWFPPNPGYRLFVRQSSR